MASEHSLPPDIEATGRGRDAPPGRGGNNWVLFLLGFLILGLVVVGIVWFLAIGDDDDAEVTEDEAGDALTAEEVVDDPLAYEGQTVTVTGVVQEQLMPQLFVIGADEPLLVFVEEGLPVEPATVARVEGVVVREGPDALVGEVDGQIPDTFTDFFRPSQLEELDEELITFIRASSVSFEDSEASQ